MKQWAEVAIINITEIVLNKQISVVPTLLLYVWYNL